MTEHLTHPLILLALRREASYFLQRFKPQQRFPSTSCRACFASSGAQTVLVLETGVGPNAAEQALTWALNNPPLGNLPYQPKMVLSAGFSGGLSSALGVGDLVLATEVADDKGNCWPATWPTDLPTLAGNPACTRGRVLTTPGLVTDLREKKRLHEECHAVAVDMESAVAARICHQRCIPYGCLRAISDDWNMPLSPMLASLVPGGRVAWGRLLLELLRAPRLTGELWRLAKQTKGAARALDLGLSALLQSPSC